MAKKYNPLKKYIQLNMFGEHLLRNLTGRAEYEIARNKKIFTQLNSQTI